MKTWEPCIQFSDHICHFLVQILADFCIQHMWYITIVHHRNTFYFTLVTDPKRSMDHGPVTFWTLFQTLVYTRLIPCQLWHTSLNTSIMSWRGAILAKDHFHLFVTNFRQNTPHDKYTLLSQCIPSKNEMTEAGIQKTHIQWDSFTCPENTQNSHKEQY